MKMIFKRAPSADNYEACYDVSDALIERIVQDYPDIGLTPIQLALKLGAGETVTVINPFGTTVHWTLEEELETVT